VKVKGEREVEDEQERKVRKINTMLSTNGYVTLKEQSCCRSECGVQHDMVATKRAVCPVDWSIGAIHSCTLVAMFSMSFLVIVELSAKNNKAKWVDDHEMMDMGVHSVCFIHLCSPSVLFIATYVVRECTHCLKTMPFCTRAALCCRVFPTDCN